MAKETAPSVAGHMPDSPHSTAELRHARSKRAAEYYLANREKIRTRRRETYRRRREKTHLLAPFRYELHCVDCSRTIFSPVPFKKRCDACRIALKRKRHFIYNHSDRGRVAAKRYRQSEKGRIARRLQDKIRRQKPGAREKATASRLAWRKKNEGRDRSTYNAWCRKNWHSKLWPRKKFVRQLNRDHTRSSKRRSWLRNRERHLDEYRFTSILEKTLTKRTQQEWRKLPRTERDKRRRILLKRARELGIVTPAIEEKLYG
jgi:hypothetical protein